MKVVVIYESLTGNTRRAAELIGAELVAAGEEAVVCPTTAVDYQALAAADLVVVGSWTDGVIIAGQRPGRVARIKHLPVMDRKPCVVFCTYAVHPGKTLLKLGAVMEGLGAEVRGGMAIRRGDLEGGARELVARVLAVVAS